MNHKFHFGAGIEGDEEDDEDEDGDDDEEEAEGVDESVEDMLETAFEMSEIARTIYEKANDSSDANQQKLADVHRLLGDVATEGG